MNQTTNKTQTTGSSSDQGTDEQKENTADSAMITSKTTNL